MSNCVSDDTIEKEIVKKLAKEYGYQSLNCYTNDPDNLNDGSGRAAKREVGRLYRLKTAALRLNPDLPEIAIERALAVLTAIAQRHDHHHRQQ